MPVYPDFGLAVRYLFIPGDSPVASHGPRYGTI
jgi:hypothetical protein